MNYKKLLGLLMVAILNIIPNTIFAAEAPVGDGQEEVYGGGGTAGAADSLTAHSSPEATAAGEDATPVGEENPCGICLEQLGELVADYDARTEGRRIDSVTMREHLKELAGELKGLLAIKIGTSEEPEDTDDRTVALHPEARTQDAQHSFHANCIRGWLKNHRSCPMCNNIIDNAGRLRLRLESLTQEQAGQGQEENIINIEENLMHIAAHIGWDDDTVKALFCAVSIIGMALGKLTLLLNDEYTVGGIMICSVFQFQISVLLSSMLTLATIIKPTNTFTLKLLTRHFIFSLVFDLAKNISLEKIFAANPHWLTKKELSDKFYKIKNTIIEKARVGDIRLENPEYVIKDDLEKNTAWFRFNPIHTYYDPNFYIPNTIYTKFPSAHKSDNDICGMCAKPGKSVNTLCGLTSIDYKLEYFDINYAITLDLRKQAHNINAHYRNTDNKIDFLKIATTIAKYAPYVVSALITAALYYQLPTARSKKEMLRNMMAATAFFMYMTSGIIMHGGFEGYGIGSFDASK